MGLGSSTCKVDERSVDDYVLKSAIQQAVNYEEEGEDSRPLLFLMQQTSTSAMEVVLYHPKFSISCFCLMADNEKKEAFEKFMQLADRLGPFIKNIKSVYNKDTLHDIIECFKEHPNWTAAHVAAELELTDCFDNEEFMKEMINHLSEEELTPLHLACKDGKDKSIAKLMQKKLALSTDVLGNTPMHYLVENHPELIEKVASLGSSITTAGDQFKASFNVLNNYSESPIHVAIRLSQETVLQLLLEKGANSRMPCGHMFAIHLALKNESRGCVEVLLKYNEECIHDRDTKYNTSPLHWVKSSKMVDVLMKHKIEMNNRGSENETALHVMAMKKRLDCAIALISNGIDVNAVCNHGKNALHYAVEARDLDMIKALLLFGVDHELKDQNGKTPLEYAQSLADSVQVNDVRDALISFTQIHRGQFRHEELEERNPSLNQKAKDEQDKAPAASVLKRKTGKEAVLCMDGGGIRGLVLTELLFGLEEVTGYQAKDLFDWISGTSTGSYLALAIADGKSIEHCQRAYFRMKQTVFQGSRPFLSEPLEGFLIKEFGQDRKMNSIEYPRLVIPAIMADRKPAVLHLFRNYDADYDHHFWVRDTRFARPKKPEEQEIWRSARCSGAAPTYFRAMDRYIDGGLIANNPTLDVLAEIHKYKKYNEKTEFNKDLLLSTSNIIRSADVKTKGTNDNLGVVVSLGTGRAPLEVHQGIDLFKPSSVWETTEVLSSARSFGELLVDQVTNSDDHVVERAMSWCEMVGLHYFRLNPALSSDVQLDENDDKTLINLLWDTRLYLKKNKEILQKAGKILIGLH